LGPAAGPTDAAGALTDWLYDRVGWT